MRNTRKAVPTTEYLKSLYEAGNIEELQRQNEIMAKRANTRMRELEKAGLDSTAALKRAKHYLGDTDYTSANRFSRSKKLSLDDLYEQTVQEGKFLRAQTSTAAGELKRREEIWSSLTSQRIDEATGDIKEPVISLAGIDDVDAYKEKFLDFLDSGAWEEFKKHLYTKHILNDAGEAVAAGASVEDLNEAFQAFKDGTSEDDLITIWNNWVSVKDSK